MNMRLAPFEERLLAHSQWAWRAPWVFSWKCAHEDNGALGRGPVVSCSLPRGPQPQESEWETAEARPCAIRAVALEEVNRGPQALITGTHTNKNNIFPFFFWLTSLGTVGKKSAGRIWVIYILRKVWAQRNRKNVLLATTAYTVQRTYREIHNVPIINLNSYHKHDMTNTLLVLMCSCTVARIEQRACICYRQWLSIIYFSWNQPNQEW